MKSILEEAAEEWGEQTGKMEEFEEDLGRLKELLEELREGGEREIGRLHRRMPVSRASLERKLTGRKGGVEESVR
jgi:hypothetical protein